MLAQNAGGHDGGWRLAVVGLVPPEAPDLDLLRLSYVCRADALLEGRPERSWVVSRIHRFFDGSPDVASARALSLSALVEEARARRGL